MLPFLFGVIMKPWMLMTLSAATSRIERIKELAEKFEIVIVDDNNFDEAVQVLDDLKKRKQIEAIQSDKDKTF